MSLRSWITAQEQKITPPAVESDKDRVFRMLTVEYKCPNCEGATFTMGPQGGMCQNVRCDCGARFNLGPFEDGKFLGPAMIAQRI